MTPTTDDQGWSDLHRRAVREAAPEVPVLDDEVREAVWRRARATTPARSRRRPWRAVVAGVVAVGVVGAAGAAAGDVFSAHTGQGPVDAEDVELGGPGERLDPAASDFAAVVDEVTGDIRFPSSADRERALAWEVDNYAGDPADRTLVSTGAVRLWMAGHSLCAWSNEWAVALRDGDVDAEQEAAGVVLEARTWPAITDTDPDLAHESEFSWLPDLERAVRADDPAAARAALERNQSCMPGLAPALGLGRWR